LKLRVSVLELLRSVDFYFGYRVAPDVLCGATANDFAGTASVSIGGAVLAQSIVVPLLCTSSTPQGSLPALCQNNLCCGDQSKCQQTSAVATTSIRSVNPIRETIFCLFREKVGHILLTY
jgi:hypothetical protein